MKYKIFHLKKIFFWVNITCDITVFRQAIITISATQFYSTVVLDVVKWRTDSCHISPVFVRENVIMIIVFVLYTSIIMLPFDMR